MPLPEKENSEPDLLFTGERFIPHQTDPLLALEHYHRYYFASRLAPHKRVLDIACGEGYGSALLSKWAGQVVGIDIDAAAIEHARSRYGSIPNLAFKAGSCEEIPAGAAEFDMAVSFELIEHLEQDSQVRFLENVRRILKDDGIFIISSPERHEYAATYETKNEFHKHELTLLEFRTILSAFFKHIYLGAQRVLFLSTMWQLDNWRNARFNFHYRKDLMEDIPCGASISQPLYLIALCSNTPIPEAVLAESNSFYLDISNSETTKNFARWARQLDEETQESRRVVRNLQNQLEERGKQLEQQLAQQEDLRKQLEERGKQLEERTAWAVNLDGQIKGKDELIATLKNELIAMVTVEMDNRAKWAFSLDAELAKEREISKHLNEAQTRLSQQLLTITSSRVYRLLAKLKLLPKS